MSASGRQTRPGKERQAKWQERVRKNKDRSRCEAKIRKDVKCIIRKIERQRQARRSAARLDE